MKNNTPAGVVAGTRKFPPVPALFFTVPRGWIPQICTRAHPAAVVDVVPSSVFKRPDGPERYGTGSPDSWERKMHQVGGVAAVIFLVPHGGEQAMSGAGQAFMRRRRPSARFRAQVGRRRLVSPCRIWFNHNRRYRGSDRRLEADNRIERQEKGDLHYDYQRGPFRL